MDIDFDPAKRDMVLRERGIDFASAAEVFAGLHATASDDRRDYGEARRIISMRYAHAKENRRWRASLD